MITLKQYEYETRLYDQVPVDLRWIFNKLQVAERLGIECGPCGVLPPHKGPWCIRPIMSLHGCGKDGWYKVEADERGIMKYRAGWFWMPWYTGRHVWTEFTDDKPVRQAGGYMDGDILRWTESNDFVELPVPLRGISKHCVIESIGGNVIEYAPKHLADNKDGMMDMKLTTDEHGSPLWEELWEVVTPWKN